MYTIQQIITVWLLIGFVTTLILLLTSEKPKFRIKDLGYIILGICGGLLTTFVIGILLIDIYILSEIKTNITTTKPKTKWYKVDVDKKPTDSL
tara:strand:- start:77 stop:355 length:279 start_codon:yes stop_codon:yes gene_type:complete